MFGWKWCTFRSNHHTLDYYLTNEAHDVLHRLCDVHLADELFEGEGHPQQFLLCLTLLAQCRDLTNSSLT